VGKALNVCVIKTTKQLETLDTAINKKPLAPVDDIYSRVFTTFTIDKSIDLLHKSAQLYSSNPKKMGEWIVFMQTTFA